MIEAWFNSSENIASLSVSIASKIPPFASKQLGYRIASSLW
jgi:hypothetical protein